jgi:hypothetical protein
MGDTLTLGGITFESVKFATPDEMAFGGEQAMKVHKLPGGARVIQTLGPDEADIEWHGQFLCADAYSIACDLDAMRAAGEEVELSWGGRSRTVVVKHFKGTVRRYPNWVEYSITCVVATDPNLGILGSVLGTIDTLIGADLGAALSIAGL